MDYTKVAIQQRDALRDDLAKAEAKITELHAWADSMLRKIEVLEAQLAALTERHEKALVEGAARLAERDEARGVSMALSQLEMELRAQIAAKDMRIKWLLEILEQRGGNYTSAELGEIARYIFATPTSEAG